MENVIVQKVDLMTREKINNSISISKKEWKSLQSMYVGNKNIREVYVEVEDEPKDVTPEPTQEEPKKKRGRKPKDVTPPQQETINY